MHYAVSQHDLTTIANTCLGICGLQWGRKSKLGILKLEDLIYLDSALFMHD